MLIKLITGSFCSRCHMIAPKLKKYAEANWYEYVEIDVQQVTPEDLGRATMLPVIRWDGEMIDFDEALARLS